MKPSTTAERLQEAMNIRGLKQVDVLRLAEPYCRAYGVNLGKTAKYSINSGDDVISCLCQSLYKPTEKTFLFTHLSIPFSKYLKLSDRSRSDLPTQAWIHLSPAS